jgi:hypothetical protein
MRTVTSLPWRDALATLLTTNHLVTIQADAHGVAHLTKEHNGNFHLVTTEPDGTQPHKTKISRGQALNYLADFFKRIRLEPNAAEKIIDFATI